MSKIKRLPKGPMKILSCVKFGGEFLAEVDIGGTLYRLARLPEGRNLGRRWVTRDGEYLNSDRALRLERKLDDTEERLDRERLFDAAKNANNGGVGLERSDDDAASVRLVTLSQSDQTSGRDVLSIDVSIEIREGDGAPLLRAGQRDEYQHPECEAEGSPLALCGRTIRSVIERLGGDELQVMFSLAAAVAERHHSTVHLDCEDDELLAQIRAFWEAANHISERWPNSKTAETDDAS